MSIVAIYAAVYVSRTELYFKNMFTDEQNLRICNLELVHDRRTLPTGRVMRDQPVPLTRTQARA